MIPEETQPERSILDAFADRIVKKDFSCQRRSMVYQMVDKVFEADFKSMDSWEEWHNYLNTHGIILAKSKENSLSNEKWYKWASKKRFVVRRSPAQKDYEWILVPEQVIENMIVLGRFDEYL